MGFLYNFCGGGYPWHGVSAAEPLALLGLFLFLAESLATAGNFGVKVRGLNTAFSCAVYAILIPGSPSYAMESVCV